MESSDKEFKIIRLQKNINFTTFLFAFIGAWNELLFAVMFLNTDANFTLPVGLYMFISKYDIHWGRMMAGATLALIPALVVFGVVQRYMVRGLALGAVKG